MTGAREHDDRWRVDAYADGQLDLAGQLEIERRLEADAALRAQVHDRRQTSALLREHAERHAAPESLRAWIAAQAAPPPAPLAAPPRAAATGWEPIRAALRRALAGPTLATAFGAAALALLAFNLAPGPWADRERLVDDVVSSHARATLGERLVDVASSDHHTVKPYLSTKLGFSPPVDDAPVAGSTLIGGRVDYLDGRPVAALVYRHGAHVVDVYVWPDRGADSAPVYAAARGYLTAHWRQAGMTHWIVSDVNTGEFHAIVEALARRATGG